MAESFYAVRRTDGALIAGDYGWMPADDESDWSAAEQDSEWLVEPVEYELVHMQVRPVARRFFPDLSIDDEEIDVDSLEVDVEYLDALHRADTEAT